MKVGKKAYGTKGLIETHLASKSSPPTIDNSMDHVTRFVSRYSLIYGVTKEYIIYHTCPSFYNGILMAFSGWPWWMSRFSLFEEVYN